jgi:hypothetical protein
MNVLILYDARSTHVSTVREHLDAFATYSRHGIYFVSAGGTDSTFEGPAPFELDAFDAVVIHYSVRLSIEQHIAPGLAELVAAYTGPKVLFIQDEYENTEAARRWISRLGITTVFTNIPEASVRRVYPAERFPNVSFIRTLTGFVPEDPMLETYFTPLDRRVVAIGYRGRRLPHHYGDLGYEKQHIGLEVRRLANERGIAVDIEVDEPDRIYGADWYRFLGSCRATLGTESGSNVFDDDGSLKRLAEEHAHLPYSEFRTRYLAGREGIVQMSQVSPKIFEAIRLRTALILFEGRYSEVVRPHEHYIPLKKNFANIDDVFSKVQDLGYLSALTDRAYRDIIERGQYSYAAFVKLFDDVIAAKVGAASQVQIVSVPFLVRRPGAVPVSFWADLEIRPHLISDAPASPSQVERASRQRAIYQGLEHLEISPAVRRALLREFTRQVRGGMAQLILRIVEQASTNPKGPPGRIIKLARRIVSADLRSRIARWVLRA